MFTFMDAVYIPVCTGRDRVVFVRSCGFSWCMSAALVSSPGVPMGVSIIVSGVHSAFMFTFSAVKVPLFVTSKSSSMIPSSTVRYSKISVVSSAVLTSRLMVCWDSSTCSESWCLPISNSCSQNVDSVSPGSRSSMMLMSCGSELSSEKRTDVGLVVLSFPMLVTSMEILVVTPPLFPTSMN